MTKATMNKARMNKATMTEAKKTKGGAFWRGAALAAALATAATGATAAEDPADGAALFRAAGLDVVLSSVEEGVRQQLAESGGGLSIETVNYAADAFDLDELAGGVAEDLDALPSETREAARAFFASPVGAKVVGIEKAINRQLTELTPEASSTILSQGGSLKDDQARGPVLSALRKDGVSQDAHEDMLRATTYALLLGAGDLRDIQDQAQIDAKVEEELKPIWELVREFDDAAYAYGFRDATADDLQAFADFLASEPGAAFITAAKASIEKRLQEASQDLELRLRTPGKKTKT